MNPLLKAKNFLENNRLASIATVSGLLRNPQIAVVYYIYDNGELYFATEKSSRKAENIMQHKKIALLVVQEKQLELLQMEGVGNPITDTEEDLRIIGLIYDSLRKKDSHETWPIMKLHPKELQAFKIDIERFKYSNFSGETIVLEGTPNDWNEMSRYEDVQLSHEPHVPHPHTSHTKK